MGGIAAMRLLLEINCCWQLAVGSWIYFKTVIFLDLIHLFVEQKELSDQHSGCSDSSLIIKVVLS